jgi:hypothetical protein
VSVAEVRTTAATRRQSNFSSFAAAEVGAAQITKSARPLLDS